jgi:hypothetical protein
VEIDVVRWLGLLILYSIPAWAVESFKIIVEDHMVRVEAPAKQLQQYSVIVINNSLSSLMGKFHAGGEDLKFISAKPSESKTVEFVHKGKATVFFKLMTPAFQDLELTSNKRAYEIPARP